MKTLMIFCFLLMTGCTVNHFAFPEKAIIETPTITQAISDEKELDLKKDVKAPTGAPWFNIIVGNVPVIITAPHATMPFREGTYRFSDGGGTGALAKALNALTGATVIYTTYSSPSDPNFYNDNDFKRALGEAIGKYKPILVLDIHGSHSYRPYDVDLGTMGGESLMGNEVFASTLIEALRNEGLTNISYNYFGASKNQTVTKFSSVYGVSAIQLEINSTWLTPSQDNLSAHRFAQLLQALVRYLKGIDANKHE
jgi:hypothetical protein